MVDPQLLSFHLMLLNDRDRMEAYRQAVFKVVQPGHTVLDVGTGSGIIALFACQAGARRVYAVDRSDIIILAREMAGVNDFADRIVFLKKEVKQVQLAEQVDVITSELIAKSVLGEDMAELIGWCRDRFLKPEGCILPERVDLRVAPAEHERIYLEAKPPVSSIYQIDFSPFEQLSINKPVSAHVPLEALLAPEQTAYSYQALTATSSDSFEATMIFEPERGARLHGFAGWFSTALAAGVELNNKPPGTSSWDNLFFPLPQPVEVEQGMTIELNLRGRSDSQLQDFWIWKTTVRKGEQVMAGHRQSSFSGRILSAESLRKAKDSWTPATNQDGKMAQLTLELMDQALSLRAIAERVRQDFSGYFETIEEAVNHVRKIAEQFGD